MRVRRNALAREKFQQPFWELSGEQRREIREQLVNEGLQKRAAAPFRTKRQAAESAAQKLFGKPVNELDSPQKKQLKQNLQNEGVLRPENSDDIDQIERKLSTAPITAQKNLGGGVNKTYKVKLASGDWAVFKTKENAVWAGTPEKEVAAWRVARLVGLHDLAAPCVLREHAGETGCLMKWWQGTLAGKAENPWDGTEDMARAAAFDYIIGNTDRHDGNWLVSKEGKLQLIDNGFSFMERPFARKGFMGRARDVEQQIAGGWFKEGAPNLPSPADLAKPYVDNQEKILEELKKLQVSEKARNLLKARIAALSQNKKWEDLPVPQYNREGNIS